MTLRIMAAQLNPHVGALTDNAAAILAAARKAAAQKVDILLTPEQSLTGYPLLDLARRHDFVDYAYRKAQQLAAQLPPQLHIIFGGVEPGKYVGRHGQLAYNVAFVAHGGEIIATSRKNILPIGGEFNEPRLFLPGEAAIITVNDVRIGIPVCEDIWHAEVCARLKGLGAEVLLVPNASPTFTSKWTVRHKVAFQRANETGLPLAYVNLVGGQDEFLFDGGSFTVNPGEEADGPAAIMPYWREAETIWTLMATGEGRYAFAPGDKDWAKTLPHTFNGAVLGLKDYQRKTGAGRNGVVLGLSGGVDSALAQVIGVQALGPRMVKAYRLPSRYTSDESMTLAEELARNTGTELDTIEIWSTYEAMMAAIRTGRRQGELVDDIARQNLQSRIRANILLSIANDEGRFVLGTGNWSETSQGYMTQGGDAVSGLNVLKGLSKTLIFEVCHWYNTAYPEQRIPERIMTRPPSAELKDDQQDTDSLPPYDVLDPVLDNYVVHGQSLREIAAQGFDPGVVLASIRRLYLSEFKRRVTPGLNLVPGSFDRKRDFPIACHPEAYQLDDYVPRALAA